MSYAEPDESGYTPAPSELDPASYQIVPSDSIQESVFTTISGLSDPQLQPYNLEPVPMPHQRTAKGAWPRILVGFDSSKTSIIFTIDLWSNGTIITVRAHVPFESWRRATCTSENTRAAIQKAYLQLLQSKSDPVIVKPGMLCLGVSSLRPSVSRHRHKGSLSDVHGTRYTTTQPVPPTPTRHQSYQSYTSNSSRSLATPTSSSNTYKYASYAEPYRTYYQASASRAYVSEPQSITYIPQPAQKKTSRKLSRKTG